jgi:hypothetical protein
MRYYSFDEDYVPHVFVLRPKAEATGMLAHFIYLILQIPVPGETAHVGRQCPSQLATTSKRAA